MVRYIFTFYFNKDGEGVRKKDSLGILFLTSLLNKAGYAATQVTCGWAGAKKAQQVFVQGHYCQKKAVNAKQKQCVMDRRNDQPTNWPT